MALVVVTPPADTPITVDDAKSHLRVVGSDDDTLISTYISAATAMVENEIGRALMPQTLKLYLDEFPKSWHGEYYCDQPILLQRPPVASVSSLKYIDADGDEQTLSANVDYVVDLYAEVPKIEPAYNMTWASTREQSNAVYAQYIAGYANAAAVPEQIKQAIRLLVCTLYEFRGPVLAGAQLSQMPNSGLVSAILSPYRVMRFD